MNGLDVAGRRYMRPAAEVDEIALAVEGHGGRIDAAQDLHLERLAPLLEEPDRRLARHLLADERMIGEDDLAHRGFDPLEISGSERRRLQEVVVEAILDGRADGDLDLGEQPLHRLRHDVRRRVAQGRQGLGETVEFFARFTVLLLSLIRHQVPIAPLRSSLVRQKSITRLPAR